MEIGSKTAEKNSAQTNKQTDRQTDRQTNRHYENNGHLAVNQFLQVLQVGVVFLLQYTNSKLKCSNNICFKN